VYDPAFYFTSQEMKQKGAEIDIPTVTIVEKPQLHILGSSSSSLEDQTRFIECRKECLLDMDKVLQAQAVIPIHDIVLFYED